MDGSLAVVVAPAGEAEELVPVAGVVDGLVEVVEVVGKGSSASFGNGSPGNNMKDASLASCFCFSKDVVPLGLMTPTICQLMHEPGAPQ